MDIVRETTTRDALLGHMLVLRMDHDRQRQEGPSLARAGS